MTTIPPSVRPLVEAYRETLAPVRGRVLGVYLHGSLVLGDYETGKSDFDAVVLTEGSWSDDALGELRRLHARLDRACPVARRLDLAYVPWSELGKGADEVAPHPVVRDGRFGAAGRGDLNAVTWWLVEHRGIAVLGPAVGELPLAVDWEDVLAAMRHNLDVYWAGKAARPHLFLSDYWVGFAVATLCRILTTLEDGQIVSKSAALTRWRERLPEEWGPLVEEAGRLRRDPGAPPRFRSRVGRARASLAFVAYARERGRSGEGGRG